MKITAAAVPGQSRRCGCSFSKLVSADPAPFFLNITAYQEDVLCGLCRLMTLYVIYNVHAVVIMSWRKMMELYTAQTATGRTGARTASLT
jgi:hypothetical protein